MLTYICNVKIILLLKGDIDVKKPLANNTKKIINNDKVKMIPGY